MTFRDDTREIQRIVGVTADGSFGPATARAVLEALRSPLAGGEAGGGARSGRSEGLSPASGALAKPGGKFEGMSPSPKAVALIREFEGYAKARPDGSAEAYPDPGSGGDPWTIGFGSTGPDVRPGTVWTRAQAEARLEADVREFAGGVVRLIGSAPTTQNEFDACVSLAYNIGLGAFGKSTLLRKHKSGDKAGAAGEFLKWNRAAGRIMPGLSRRRAAESALYRGPR